jgi:NTE family protein
LSNYLKIETCTLNQKTVILFSELFKQTNMTTKPKQALVLSGGSIKGAFEAGAVKAFIEKGFRPDCIFGISVGSLNGTFLANELALQKKRGEEIDWSKASEVLWNFWFNRINSPKDLVKTKSNFWLLLSLNWGLLFKKFDSILDTTPLRNLLYSIVDADVIKNTPVELNVGTVNVYTSEIKYVSPSEPNFLKYVMASTAIPVTMPAEFINNMPFLDGGLRDVAPIGRAINDGATQLAVICCQSEKIETVQFNSKDLVKLISRLMDIIVNETVNNDIKTIERINKLIADFPDYRKSDSNKKYEAIDYKVVRPEKNIDTEIENFTHQDIVNMLNLGYNTAMKQLEGVQY